jgi:hypothetical protein
VGLAVARPSNPIIEDEDEDEHGQEQRRIPDRATGNGRLGQPTLQTLRPLRLKRAFEHEDAVRERGFGPPTHVGGYGPLNCFRRGRLARFFAGLTAAREALSLQDNAA